MSAEHAMSVMLAHLIDEDSLEVILREGLEAHHVPDPDVYEAVAWAVDYYDESGLTRAPSETAFKQRWSDVIVAHDTDLDYAPEDTVEWCLDTLKDRWARSETELFVRNLASEMAETAPGKMEEVLSRSADTLLGAVTSMARRDTKVDAREGMTRIMADYERREEDASHFRGLALGMDPVDQHTNGLHPGELALVAAPPKTGKSFLLNYVALKEWERGKETVLFTLENSPDMTLQRILCLHAGLDSQRMESGQFSEHEKELMRRSVEVFEQSGVPLHVFQPDRDERTVEKMVRTAALYGVDSILIDQLTFVRPTDERAPRHIQIRDVMHGIKEAISTSRKAIPCLMAHQINREGTKAARSTGYLLMDHLAEGSEAERTADVVYGLYRSGDDVLSARAKLQMLAGRRFPLKHWELAWNLSAGYIDVRGEWTMPHGT